MLSSRGQPSGEERGASLACYRNALVERILAYDPRSVLLIADQSQIAARLSECGIRVTSATPADASWQSREPQAAFGHDVVALEYSAHHLAVPGESLADAAAIARDAIVILEPWYDLSFKCQVVGQELDRWTKVIDRRAGMIHHDFLAAGKIAELLWAAGDFRISANYLLEHRMMTLSELNADTGPYRRSQHCNLRLVRILDALQARAARFGVSAEGASLICAERL